MKCTVYLRVSTEDQAERETPIESQKPAILEWAERNNATILPDWIVEDRGWSGSTAERPGFKRILDAARDNPPFDTLLVYSYDRLFRNNRKFNRYMDELEGDYGLRVISVTESEEPELLTDIRSVINEEARRAIVKHTKRALAQIGNAGLSCGGSPGKPIDTGWVRSGVRFILLNEVYIGTRIYNRTRKTSRRPSRFVARPPSEWIVVQDAHPAIISKDLWDRVQKRQREISELHNHSLNSTRKLYPLHPLSGLIKCGECGANFLILSGRGNHNKVYYGCSYARYRGPKICKNNVRLEKGAIEQWTYGVLQESVLDPEVFGKVCEKVRVQLGKMSLGIRLKDRENLKKKTRNELNQIKIEVGRIVAAIRMGQQQGSKALNAELTRLETRQENLERELQVLSRKPEKPPKISQATIERHVKELSRALTSSDPAELNTFLREHISAIIVYPNGRKRLIPTRSGLLHKALKAVRGSGHNSVCRGLGLHSYATGRTGVA